MFVSDLYLGCIGSSKKIEKGPWEEEAISKAYGSKRAIVGEELESSAGKEEVVGARDKEGGEKTKVKEFIVVSVLSSSRGGMKSKERETLTESVGGTNGGRGRGRGTIE